jgi:hypothetical protein
MVFVKCAFQNSLHSYSIRRLISRVFPGEAALNVTLQAIDAGTVHREYNMPLNSYGRRWLHFSLEQCAAFDMKLSELVEGFCASANDEELRFLECLTLDDYKKDAFRKQLLINNMAATLAGKCRLMPETSEQTPVTKCDPVKPATSRRSLSGVFSQGEGATASQSCLAALQPPDRGSVLVSKAHSDAASAGMIINTMLLISVLSR